MLTNLKRWWKQMRCRHDSKTCHTVMRCFDRSVCGPLKWLYYTCPDCGKEITIKKKVRIK